VPTSSHPIALISVSDKTGIVEFARTITELGWRILSTGGTAEKLRENDINVIDVSDITGYPPLLDGRVKTLHPSIHAALLARRDHPNDLKEIAEQGIDPIDMVVINLYPFKSKGMSSNSWESATDLIDIGGPTMIRASAKNSDSVIVITNPSQYDSILSELKNSDVEKISISKQTRLKLAAEAFNLTCEYDALISSKTWSFTDKEPMECPNHISTRHHSTLRYGENPHQEAVVHHISHGPNIDSQSLASSRHLQGPPLSYNNHLDLESALRLARSISSINSSKPHACVIVKHNNPCGVALAETQVEAWNAALASDPESAFGCIIAFNHQVTISTAIEIGSHFLECIIAPSFDRDAINFLSQKAKRRILDFPNSPTLLSSPNITVEHRIVSGQLLIQTTPPPKPLIPKVVTKSLPDNGWEELIPFGLAVSQAVSSNSILITQGTATVGIGPGQTSRVEAVRIATRRAGERGKGGILWSDAFFPFRDGIDAVAESGVSTIIQPGGSIRDAEVIAAANEHGIAMIMTGRRTFRH